MSLTRNFNRMCSYTDAIIFLQLICGAVNISMPMFIIFWVIPSIFRPKSSRWTLNLPLQSLQNLNPAIMYYCIVGILFISSVLPYCYGATQILIILSNNSARVYNSSWYRLPVSEQRSVSFLIKYTQKEREIKGFGFVPCSMSAFLKVNFISFKYFIFETFFLFFYRLFDYHIQFVYYFETFSSKTNWKTFRKIFSHKF